MHPLGFCILFVALSQNKKRAVELLSFVFANPSRIEPTPNRIAVGINVRMESCDLKYTSAHMMGSDSRMRACRCFEKRRMNALRLFIMRYFLKLVKNILIFNLIHVIILYNKREYFHEMNIHSFFRNFIQNLKKQEEKLYDKKRIAKKNRQC